MKAMGLVVTCTLDIKFVCFTFVQSFAGESAQQMIYSFFSFFLCQQENDEKNIATIRKHISEHYKNRAHTKPIQFAQFSFFCSQSINQYLHEWNAMYQESKKKREKNKNKQQKFIHKYNNKKFDHR